MLEVFGFFLMVLIGLELLETANTFEHCYKAHKSMLLKLIKWANKTFFALDALPKILVRGKFNHQQLFFDSL